MFNKKGVEWDYIVPIILGLIFVALFIGFIFNDYFVDDKFNDEICRQSIVLRNSLPEVELTTFGVLSFKDDFPLKCQTQVVNIDYNNTDKAEKEILDKMAECWYLMGKGEYSIYPSAEWSKNSHCFVCARIHFDSKVKNFYVENYGLKKVDNRIDFVDALNKPFKDKISYKAYLTNRGQNPYLIDNKSSSSFFVDEATKSVSLKSILEREVGTISYPNKIYVDKGDLFITASSWVFEKNKTISQLLFYQWEDGAALNELSNKVIFKGKLSDFWKGNEFTVCGNWEGIPA